MLFPSSTAPFTVPGKITSKIHDEKQQVDTLKERLDERSGSRGIRRVRSCRSRG